MGLIYKITSPSGKAYIGQTKLTLMQRWRLHCTPQSGCIGIKNAIAKYGKDAMRVEVIVDGLPDALLDEHEKEAILILGTYGKNGYNLTPGGETRPMSCPEIAAKHKETMNRAEVRHRISRSLSHTLNNQDARKRSEQVKAAWKTNRNRRVASLKAAHSRPGVTAKAMAGIHRMWEDSSKRQARADAIRKANKRDPEINKRRSESVKKTLAAKKAAGLAIGGATRKAGAETSEAAR